MGKKKIVIDTNNLISSLGWNGKSRDLIRKVIDKEFDLFISIKQIIELKRVLNYPKFGFTEEQKRKFLQILFDIAKIIDTKDSKISVITEDPADNMLIECAVKAGADYIISGDNHLKKLKRFKNVRILSVNEFLRTEKVKNSNQ